jgi:hypothetical protein
MEAATGDDGGILVKIVEVAFVPESQALAKQMSGDESFHGVKQIGNKLDIGFTCFTLAVRKFAKTNTLDVADDIFYIYDNTLFRQHCSARRPTPSPRCASPAVPAPSDKGRFLLSTASSFPLT